MPSESRRRLLRRLSAVAALTGTSGCTAFTSVDATVRFVNGYKYDEVAEYYIQRGRERSSSRTVQLTPDEERAFEHSLRAGGQRRRDQG